MADRYSIIKMGPVIKDPKKVEQEEKEYALLLKFLGKSSGNSHYKKVIETLERLYKNHDISYSNYTEFMKRAQDNIRTRSTTQRPLNVDADFFNSLMASRRTSSSSSGGSCSGARNGGC